MFLTRSNVFKKEKPWMGTKKGDEGNAIIYTLRREGKGEFEERVGKDGGKLVRVGRAVDGRKVVENKVIIFFSGRKSHQLDEDQGDRLL